MSTELIDVQNAVAEFDRVAGGLAALKGLYAGVVYDVRTTKGMDDAKAARLALRKPRYEIEAIRKSAKAPIIALGKKLDSEAARITAEIMTIEGPVDEQIKNEEKRKEDERLARIEAERKRVEDIQAHINYIRGLPLKGSGKTSAHAQSILEEAQGVEIGDEFAEFADEASAALASAVAALTGIVAERQAAEAEQARIRAEREELAKLRAAQAEREKAERDRLAEEERIAKVARDAETARVQAELAAERARIAEEDRVARIKRDAETAAAEEALRQQRAEQEREAAKRDAIAKAEQDRIQAEREAQWDAQQDELRRQREELERQQDEIRKAQAPVTQRPRDKEIIASVAERFQVDVATAVEWILEIDFSQLSIAA